MKKCMRSLLCLVLCGIMILGMAVPAQASAIAGFADKIRQAAGQRVWRGMKYEIKKNENSFFADDKQMTLTAPDGTKGDLTKWMLQMFTYLYNTENRGVMSPDYMKVGGTFYHVPKKDGEPDWAQIHYAAAQGKDFELKFSLYSGEYKKISLFVPQNGDPYIQYSTRESKWGSPANELYKGSGTRAIQPLYDWRPCTISMTESMQWRTSGGKLNYSFPVYNWTPDKTITHFALEIYCVNKSGEKMVLSGQRLLREHFWKNVGPGKTVKTDMIPLMSTAKADRVAEVWVSVSEYTLKDGTEVTVSDSERRWVYYTVDHSGSATKPAPKDDDVDENSSATY